MKKVFIIEATQQVVAGAVGEGGGGYSVYLLVVHVR
jgi:hypothetical protein